MADLAMASLATDGKPACAADKYQVVIHIDANRAANVSAETFPPHHCALESDRYHFPLAATTARRLACDAALVTVLEDATGNVLNVGRGTRTIPPAIRRALGLHIDARTAVTLWQAEAMDYKFAVGTLMDIADAHARRPQQMT
jgi:hypothetical protein